MTRTGLVGAVALGLILLLAGAPVAADDPPAAAPTPKDSSDGPATEDPAKDEPAAEPAADPAAAEKAAPGVSSASFELKDGAKIIGDMLVEAFTIDTGYGLLVVPVSDIFSVRFGKRSDPDLLARIEALIASLGASDFSVRDKASAGLTELGALAEAELQAALEHDDAEVRARAKKILEAIAKEATDDDDGILEEDEIVTARFTMRGSLEVDEFAVETRFGPLSIPKKHVVSIRFREPPTMRELIKVPSTASAQGSFHDTGIEIRRGDEITIAARGAVTIGGWGMTVTPDGVANNRFMGNLPLGCLVMKIGDGPLVQLGASWSDRADRRGKLKLAIAAPNQNNTGEFKVKVTVRHKLD